MTMHWTVVQERPHPETWTVLIGNPGGGSNRLHVLWLDCCSVISSGLWHVWVRTLRVVWKMRFQGFSVE